MPICYTSSLGPRRQVSLYTYPILAQPHTFLVTPPHSPHAPSLSHFTQTCRYGRKLEAVALLQEWCRDIGSEAGLDPTNTQLYSGAVGVKESRLELEVEFETLSELETFWSSIPPTKHRAWGQKLQTIVIDGSPEWQVYRTVDAFDAITTSSTGSLGVGEKQGVVLERPSSEDMDKYGGENNKLMSAGETTDSGLSIVTDEDDIEIVLDWKGDPMKINKGDKLPFRF